MSDAAILVEGLGKRYRLGQHVGYKTLRETLLVAYHTPTRVLAQNMRRFRRSDSSPTPPPARGSEYIWALKDVNFEVKQGEAIGIIGRNGSGKSTLLKILSRITAPTEGSAEIRGRLGSLLEVGTGFHPELTGRENVYLNGAIIGMKKSDIDRKFDEIVAFAEIERFLDTPVKRYSSGMYVRLAFAVASHLEPDILVVDEVLAVGDAAFQQKCLGKMDRVTGEGRTVLFVSHNMESIRRLCQRSLQLESGTVVQTGPSAKVVDQYLRSARGQDMSPERQFPADPQKDTQLLSAKLMNAGRTVTSSFACDEPLVIDLVCDVRRRVPSLFGKLSIQRDDGTIAMLSESCDTTPDPLATLPVGTYSYRITIPARTLAPGDYQVSLVFASHAGGGTHRLDSPGVIGRFRLDDSTTPRGNTRPGFFSTILDWQVTPKGL